MQADNSCLKQAELLINEAKKLQNGRFTFEAEVHDGVIFQLEIFQDYLIYDATTIS